ncbi:MAG: T9SS type A sorting domain-containing protein [Saprospiraceae bacterium]|nr:T9SS type A sorting domain-containing protein [Saprospiraceae bacterium]
MKTLQLTLAICMACIIQPCFAQDCEGPQSFTKLEVNQVRSGLVPSAGIWNLPGENGYLVPKEKEYNHSGLALLLGGLWMGGFDPGGKLKIAAQTYGSTHGNLDYWPGPIVNGTTTNEACKNWDRFFRIKKAEVEEHLNFVRQFDLLGRPVPEHLIPASIRAWPGNGNFYFETENGFPLEGGSFTFFFDKNQNGIYEPQTGDYPAIETKMGDWLVPDEMVYWVFNDVGNIHNESNSDKIGAEIHAIAYAFSQPGNLDYSQFYTYRVINKSTERLDDFRFGLWVDPEVGCHNRNMSGCDSVRSLAFYYAPEIDPQNCPISTPDTFPMLGVDFLDVSVSGSPYSYRPMETFGYYQSAAIGNPRPATTDPQTGLEFYNYLIGLNRGGNPLDNNGKVSTFAFPSSPDCMDPTTCWNMCLDSMTYFDRRTIQATGPVTLQPNTYMQVTFATLYTDDLTYPCPGNQALLNISDEVQNLYNRGFESLLLSDKNPIYKNEIKVYPNPTNGKNARITIKNLPLLSSIYVYDLNGNEIFNKQEIEQKTFELNESLIQLQKGIYIITVLVPDGSQFTFKQVVL